MTDASECSALTIARSSSTACETSRTLRAPAAETGVLSVYARLIDALARAGVAWCYWKSSRRTAEALAGKTDLDILVGRASQHEARRVLLECGFRLFLPVADRADLTVECYLAHDEPSGQIAHVDLHTRLTLGGALLRTHWLPWEDALIRRAGPSADSGLPLLDPVSEAVLLVVRSSLELRWFGPIMARKWSLATRKFALDRALLASRVEREAVRARAEELLGARIAAPLAEALFDPRPLQKQHDLRRRVRQTVARFRTCGVLEAVLRGWWRGLRVAADALNRQLLHWPHPWNRRVRGGGAIVAVIGVDGAGKSTLVRGLREWLQSEVDVLPLYFGSGDGRPSWFLAPLKALLPLASLLVARKPRGSSRGELTDAAPSLGYALLLAIWATVLAVEKRAKLRAARQAARRGMVVITDRFPQDEIPDFNDGPLLPRLGYAPRWLRAFEASCYALAREVRPDLVIKLVAPPELIASREATMDPHVIQSRTAAVGRLMLGGAGITTISASQPVAEVVRIASIAVWRSL
jgi:thymidylate kinase